MMALAWADAGRATNVHSTVLRDHHLPRLPRDRRAADDRLAAGRVAARQLRVPPPRAGRAVRLVLALRGHRVGRHPVHPLPGRVPVMSGSATSSRTRLVSGLLLWFAT